MNFKPEGEFMKYLIIAIGITLTNFAALASSLSADVSCGEFKYMNSLRINLDLKQMTYEVFLTLTPDQSDEFIRSGDIGLNPIKSGPYTIYRLIENGKTVGFLKAVDQQTPLRHSSLTFTEQGWSNQIRCVIKP